MELETKRQFVHMSGFFLGIYVKWANDAFGYAVPFATFALALLIGYSVSSAYKNGTRVPLLAHLIDYTERPDVVKERPGKGALSFFWGSLFALVLFGYNMNVVSASIVILALGDSVSTLVGRNFGRHKIQYNTPKSWEGTLSGAIFAAAGASLLLSPVLAIIGALAGMIAESLPFKADDNIVVPIVAGAAISLALYLQM